MTQRHRTQYPSARTSAVEQIFKLIVEEKTWNPNFISVLTLKTLSIAPSKETLLIQSLRFLGLLDDDDRPTEAFSSLRENLVVTLEKLVRQAYGTIFDQIPISRINQQTLVKFFMENGYDEDTAEYQGTLFVYLCRTAGIDLPNASVSFTRARFKKQKK